MNRFTFGITGLIAALILAAMPGMLAAQTPEPIPPTTPPAIPYYPGGLVELELTLKQDDILPYAVSFADALLKTVPEERSTLAQGFSEVVKDLSEITYLQMAIKTPVDAQQVIGFYTRIPNNSSMRRVLRQVEQSGATLLVYSGVGGEGLFGIRIAPVPEDESIWRLQVCRVSGKLDFSRVSDLIRLRWSLMPQTVRNIVSETE